MSSNADHNYELIEFVAEGLGEAFLAEVAFVGGCTTAMLVTDTAVLDDIRFTDDVDLVVRVGRYQRLEPTHRTAGCQGIQDHR